MIETIRRVIAAEGLPSAIRRAQDRVSEFMRRPWKLPRTDVLNVIGCPLAARFGGVPLQLAARLEEERRMRPVAVIDRIDDLDAAIARTGAHTIHVEGMAGIPIASLLHRSERLILTLHDFSLISSQPHVLEGPRPAGADELLARAQAVVFPSRFLREQHGIDGRVIEPAIRLAPIGRVAPIRNRIAFAGSVQPHKGGALLADLIRATGGAEWHILGGGDATLLRELRPLARVHGYYRAGTLPALLARHRIALAVLPSIVPESYSLTLSECWSAHVPVVAFDLGALAERITTHGGGWLADDAAAMAAILQRWLRGELATTIPTVTATPRAAALAHLELYR